MKTLLGGYLRTALVVGLANAGTVMMLEYPQLWQPIGVGLVWGRPDRHRRAGAATMTWTFGLLLTVLVTGCSVANLDTTSYRPCSAAPMNPGVCTPGSSEYDEMLCRIGRELRRDCDLSLGRTPQPIPPPPPFDKTPEPPPPPPVAKPAPRRRPPVVRRPSPAAPAGAMVFSMPTCWGGDDPRCPNIVYAIGTIHPSTPDDFKAFVRDVHAKIARGARPNDFEWVILFDSAGGALGPALQLGAIIRENKWHTLVGLPYNLPSGGSRVSQCISACVYAFIGGAQRLVTGNNVVGVHKFFSMDGPGDDASAQEVVAVLNMYLDTMGVSRLFQDVAGLTPSDRITFLTAQQAITLGVSN